MAADSPKSRIKDNLKRILSNMRKAWWVLLIIVIYMAMASAFLGTSCLMASTLGLPCPGCGSTRSLVLLLQGDIFSSLYYFPMLIPSIIMAGMYIVLSIMHEQRPRYLEKTLAVFAVVLVSVYALRMLLMFPDHPPMVINNQAIVPRIIAFVRSIL